jgi:spoIIIJ-associated protein
VPAPAGSAVENAGPERGDRFRGARTPPGGSSQALTGDALAAEGRRVAEQLLSAMGFDATLRATVDGDRVTVVATIEDGENLIAGENDEVRQSMQQILNRMINRGEGVRYHLQLEINDFWEKRETDLKALAHRLAEDALARNGEVVTDYLNSQERRIIHVTLREDTRVKTWSLGIGHIKRLAVAPADYAGGPAGES